MVCRLVQQHCHILRISLRQKPPFATVESRNSISVALPEYLIPQTDFSCSSSPSSNPVPHQHPQSLLQIIAFQIKPTKPSLPLKVATTPSPSSSIPPPQPPPPTASYPQPAQSSSPFPLKVPTNPNTSSSSSRPRIRTPRPKQIGSNLVAHSSTRMTAGPPGTRPTIKPTTAPSPKTNCSNAWDSAPASST